MARTHPATAPPAVTAAVMAMILCALGAATAGVSCGDRHAPPAIEEGGGGAASRVEGERGVAEEPNNYTGTGNPVAVVETNMGTIRFELFEDLAPITAGNFIDLAESGFYDGIYFHRVIDDFVVQGGDPNTRNMNPCDDGWGGSEQTIPLEIHENLSHVDGAVGMARSSDPDSASSQFYICDGPQHNLDGDYAVFGLVIEGIDVVRSIASVEKYPDYRPCYRDHPLSEVTMERVTIEYPEVNITGEGAGARTEGDGGDGRGEGPGGAGAIVGVAAAVIIILAALYYLKRRKGKK